MSEKWEFVEHGTKHLMLELVKERDEVEAKAQEATRAAARKASSILQRVAAAKRGYVRTRLQDTPSGTRVSAVSNLRIDRARLDAAAAGGAKTWEASDE